MSPYVLIDTSVWVEYFNRPESVRRDSVLTLLDEDRVAIVGVVGAELIRGCRTAKERQAIELALLGLHQLELSFADWVAIGTELFDLRRRGITVSLSDAAIAHACRVSGSLLYTLDSDFEHFKDIARFN